MIEIIPYGPQWETAHAVFASRYWTKRRRKESRYIYWKFRGRSTDEMESFLLAVENGIVIGQLGLVPCQLKIGEIVVSAQWACDLMVDTSLRGKGIAAALYKRAYQNTTVTLGSDPSPAATISMMRAGFQQVRGPWKFVFPLQASAMGKIKRVNLGLLGFIPHPMTYLILGWRRVRKVSARITQIDDQAYSQLRERYLDNSCNHIVHDETFVKWRLSSLEKYYPGFQLYKVAEGFFSIATFGDKIVVGDWGADRWLTYLDLVSEIVHQTRNSGVNQVRILSNNTRQTVVLRCLGWLRFRTRTSIIHYTPDSKLSSQMEKGTFWYSQLDSDENI